MAGIPVYRNKQLIITEKIMSKIARLRKLTAEAWFGGGRSASAVNFYCSKRKDVLIGIALRL